MAKRPVLYVGQGVIQAEATEELRQFAARANIPVTTTLQGMGAFDELDERSLCMLGMHGHVAANRAMQQADLIIAMGARFDDRVTGKLPAFAPEARRAAAAGRGGFIHFEVRRGLVACNAPSGLDFGSLSFFVMVRCAFRSPCCPQPSSLCTDPISDLAEEPGQACTLNHRGCG